MRLILVVPLHGFMPFLLSSSTLCFTHLLPCFELFSSNSCPSFSIDAAFGRSFKTRVSKRWTHAWNHDSVFPCSTLTNVKWQQHHGKLGKTQRIHSICLQNFTELAFPQWRKLGTKKKWSTKNGQKTCRSSPIQQRFFFLFLSMAFFHLFSYLCQQFQLSEPIANTCSWCNVYSQ